MVTEMLFHWGSAKPLCLLCVVGQRNDSKGKKEKKKKTQAFHCTHTWILGKGKKKNSNVSLQTHLDSWRLFYRNTEWVRVLALPFEMLNLLNCPVSQFLRDYKVFVRIAKLMLTVTLTCLPPSALHFLSMWEIWEKLRRFPGSPSQLAPSGVLWSRC